MKKRLEEDASIENSNPKFERAVELELNFIKLTDRGAIDYVNLGDFMRCVYDEFKKAFKIKCKEKEEKSNDPNYN
jgi:hypothetical protein